MKKNRQSTTRGTLAGILCAIAMSLPHAEADQDQSASQPLLKASELEKALSPKAPVQEERSRGIALPEANRAAVQRKPSVDIQLHFKFDSVELADSASKVQVAEIGKALSGPTLSPYRFRIIGHTDTVGKADYNKGLSERRARRIVALLIEKWKVSPNKLVFEGRGLTQPIKGIEGKDPRNRRVQIELIK